MPKSPTIQIPLILYKRLIRPLQSTKDWLSLGYSVHRLKCFKIQETDTPIAEYKIFSLQTNSSVIYILHACFWIKIHHQQTISWKFEYWISLGYSTHRLKSSLKVKILIPPLQSTKDCHCRPIHQWSIDCMHAFGSRSIIDRQFLGSLKIESL